MPLYNFQPHGDDGCFPASLACTLVFILIFGGLLVFVDGVLKAIWGG